MNTVEKYRKDLDVIIAMADQLKDKATGLRRKLAPFQEPAPKGGKSKKNISAIHEAKLIINRTKNLKRV